MAAQPIPAGPARLRHLHLADAARMMALNAEPSTGKWLPSHVYASVDDAVAAMQFLIGCYSSPADPRRGPYVLALEDATTAALIGHVGFSPIGGDVEISYAVAEAARGRGYANASVRAACEWVARTFGVAEVIAITAAENIDSTRLLARTGFVHERDEVRPFQGSAARVSQYRWRCPASALPNGPSPGRK